MRTIRMLTPWERTKYRDHLLRLGPEDRRRRFGGAIDDCGIAAVVDRIDFRTAAVLAVFNDRLEVVAAVMVAADHDCGAELAFSVEEGHRGNGLGRALLGRAILWARNRGFDRVDVVFLYDNDAMRHLARRAGMRIVTRGGECEGFLDIAAANVVSLWSEAVGEQVAIADVAVKANWRAADRVTRFLRAA